MNVFENLCTARQMLVVVLVKTVHYQYTSSFFAARFIIFFNQNTTKLTSSRAFFVHDQNTAILTGFLTNYLPILLVTNTQPILSTITQPISYHYTSKMPLYNQRHNQSLTDLVHYKPNFVQQHNQA